MKKRNKTRILILKFPHNSLFGGGEVHTLSLVSELSKRGFEFFLFSSCPVLLKEFKERGWAERKNWAGIEPVSIKGLVFFIFCWPLVAGWLIWKLRESKKIFDSDIIYCLSLTEKVLLSLPARWMGMKVVWMEHLRLERSLLANPLRFFYVWWSKYATVVTVSKAVRRQLLEIGVPDRSLKVIYNGVEMEELLKIEPRGMRGEKTEVVIGTACRLCAEKGLADLIGGFKRAERWGQQKGLKLRLLIAGKGPRKDELERLIIKEGLRGKAELVGFQKDLSQFLPKLDIFALTPVRRESFGMAAAEAAAAGLPVVATNISGLAEVVEDGQTGLVVPIGDREAIGTAIFNLARKADDRLMMGSQGRERVKKYFSKDKMIANFEGLFKEVFNEDRH